jgi:PIN domain nuclease of toxin-antitoxin system
MGERQMKLLLDAHVWFWAAQTPEKLSATCRQQLENEENALFVSTMSTLELGKLLQGKRIEIKGTLEAWVRRSLEELGIESVEISHAIAALAYALPGKFHQDPADRILVATAIEKGLTLVTADERILG